MSGSTFRGKRSPDDGDSIPRFDRLEQSEFGGLGETALPITKHQSLVTSQFPALPLLRAGCFG
jgi:hypothetical protein